MKTKLIQWLHAMSVPKMITVLCLLGLGSNGLVQVGLQKDIAAKAQKLSTQITETQQLSGGMKNGLTGLNDLQQSTVHMESTLQELQTTTQDMDQGLSTLGRIVAGIDQSVTTIGQSTRQSVNQIDLTKDAASQLLGFLEKISQVNAQVISNLNQMIQDQKAVNQNLESMNHKTGMLPSWGGN